MKDYLFQVPVTEVKGYQWYTVQADSEDEARELLESGQGEFYHEELEVYDLSFKQASLNEVQDLEED